MVKKKKYVACAQYIINLVHNSFVMAVGIILSGVINVKNKRNMSINLCCNDALRPFQNQPLDSAPGFSLKFK